MLYVFEMVEFQKCGSVLPHYLSTKKPTYSMQKSKFHLYFETFLILLARIQGPNGNMQMMSVIDALKCKMTNMRHRFT